MTQNNTEQRNIPTQKWILVGVVAAVAAILLVTQYPIIFWFAMVAGVAVAGTWHVSEKQRAIREYTARHFAWASLSVPEIIRSTDLNESDESLNRRAAEFRAALKASGNPYWDEIPVIVFPYSPMIYKQGELTMSWPRYKREVAEREYMENMEWGEKIKDNKVLYDLFRSQVMGLVDESKLETV